MYTYEAWITYIKFEGFEPDKIKICFETNSIKPLNVCGKCIIEMNKLHHPYHEIIEMVWTKTSENHGNQLP